MTGSGWVTMEKEQPRAAAAPMQPRAAPKHFNAVEQAWPCYSAPVTLRSAYYNFQPHKMRLQLSALLEKFQCISAGA